MNFMMSFKELRSESNRQQLKTIGFFSNLCVKNGALIPTFMNISYCIVVKLGFSVYLQYIGCF